MKEIEPKHFTGSWESSSGQKIIIRKLPLIGVVVFYKPLNGRLRGPFFCSLQDNKLHVGLSLFHWLDTMLILKPILSSKLSEQICIGYLVPELEVGPESRAEIEGFGFPWALPLQEFKHVQNV